MSQYVKTGGEFVDLTNATMNNMVVTAFATEEGPLIIGYWGEGANDYIIIGKLPEEISISYQKQLYQEINSLIGSSLVSYERGTMNRAINDMSGIDSFIKEISLTQEGMDLLYQDKMNSLKQPYLTRSVACLKGENGFSNQITYHDDQRTTSSFYQKPQKLLESYFLTPLEIKNCNIAQKIRYISRNGDRIIETIPKLQVPFAMLINAFDTSLQEKIKAEKEAEPRVL